VKRIVAGALNSLVSAARREVSMVAALCALAGGLAVFVQLADETSENETHAFDMAVLSALREPGRPAEPLGPHWLTTSARDLTSLGSTTVLALLGLCAIGFLLMQRRRAAALLVLASVGGGLALSNGLKLVFQRARPEEAYRAVEATQYSFPSGHALISTVTYLTLGALVAHAIRERSLKLYVQSLAVLLAFLIGLSRIYLGVHWTTDVLAGWGVGAAWAMVLWLVVWWMDRKGRLAQPKPTT
jgi:undecaprenyl-diphosphatase